MERDRAVSEGKEFRCGNCGAGVEPASSFCHSCGSPLGEGGTEGGAFERPLTDDIDATVAPQGGVPKELENFRIEEEISRGGMGVVFRATDPKLDREVAIKVIAPDLASDENFRARFISESRSIASLDSQFILPIYQTGEGKGTLFLVTKLIEGGDLAQAIGRRGKFTISEVATVVSQIGDALDTAHAKGLVHRDVKPANILIEPGNGEGARYLLADFGVATTVDAESGLTNAGEVLGTVDYMAPEQIEGRKVDGRTDIYALGCVAMELLTGSAPFKRDSKQATIMAHLHDDPKLPGKVDGTDPEGLAEIFGIALAKDPERRFSTCSAFARALEASVEDSSIPVPTTATQKVVGRGAEEAPKSNPATGSGRGIALLAVGLVVVAVAAVGAIFLTSGESDTAQPPIAEVRTDDEIPPDEGGETPPLEDEVPPDEGGETPPSEEVATTISLTPDDATVTDPGRDYEVDFYSAYDFSESSASEEGELPTIVGKDYRDALVIGDTTFEKRPAQIEFTLNDYTGFSADLGVLSDIRSSRVLRVQIKATSGETGAVEPLWDSGPITSSMSPKPIDLDLDPGLTKMLILISGEEDRNIYVDDWVVLANPKFTTS